MSLHQSALHPAGDHATHTLALFDIFLLVTGLFFVAVLLFLGWAIWRRDRGSIDEQRLRIGVTIWAAAITIGLFGLTMASYATDRSLFDAAGGAPSVTIKVTAQQWWWDVDYDATPHSPSVKTANEIHIPLGRPVKISLTADDVIHSLWIPNLAGKQDLIPGRPTDLELRPRELGHFRAQCAEFCGLEHAHMALDVFVETPADYAAWLARSSKPAPTPVTAAQKRGFELVTGQHCAGCHAISGTSAFASVGPDLTHVASRASLAAGELPDTRQWLARWIADPQTIKPGNRMPEVPLSRAQRDDVVAYLETLR